MQDREIHIKSHQKLAAQYRAARENMPTSLPCHAVVFELLKQVIIQKLQAILQTNSKDWKLICSLSRKYEKPIELNEILNTLTFLDINCGAGDMLATLLRAWIQAKSELSLLFFPDGRRILQVAIKVAGEHLQANDVRDNGLCEYFAPNLVRRKTYQHAVTGKTTVIEEGKIKSEMQLLQEAIFEEKKRFVLQQIYAVSADFQGKKLTEQALLCELSQHLYYTLESDYADLVALPEMGLNIIWANPLQGRLPKETAWAVFGKKEKEKDWENLFLLRKKYQQNPNRKLLAQIQKLQKKMIEIAIRHEERFELWQKLQATFYQKYEQNSLFEPVYEEKTEKEKLLLQKEIEKYAIALGLKEKELQPLDWAITFPELADEQGIFRGADVILSDIRPEKLPDLPKITDKFSWKNAVYQRFVEQALQKCLLPQGCAALILPTFLLQKQDAADIRQSLLTAYQISRITSFSEHEICLLIEKKANENAEIAVFEQDSYIHSVGKQYFVAPNYQIDISQNSENQDFIYQIEKEAVRLSTIATFVKGITISQKYLLDNEGIKFIKASNISPLKIEFQHRFVPIDYAEWQARIGEFEGENWVYVRLAAGKIVASVSDAHFIFGKDVYGIKLNPLFSKHYLASWLNSAIFQQYIRLTCGEISPQNIVNILENMPLPLLETEKMASIERLTQEIIFLQNGGEEVEKKWEELEGLWAV